MTDAPDTAQIRADLERAEQPQAAASVLDLIERLKPEVERSLQDRRAAEILARHYYTAIRFNAQLMACTAESQVGALLLTAQMRLEPGPLGHVWLVPFKGQVVWMLGYTGIRELGRRGGAVGLKAEVVWSCDDFERPWSDQRGYRWHLKPAPESQRDDAERLGVLVTWKEGSQWIPHYVEPGRIDAELRSSKRRDKAELRNEDWYWRKTGVRDSLRWLPASADLGYAAAMDEGTVTGVDSEPVGDGPLLAVPAVEVRDDA